MGLKDYIRNQSLPSPGVSCPVSVSFVYVTVTSTPAWISVYIDVGSKITT